MMVELELSMGASADNLSFIWQTRASVSTIYLLRKELCKNKAYVPICQSFFELDGKRLQVRAENKHVKRIIFLIFEKFYLEIP